MALTKPTLLTFDIFGTVLDWRRGLAQAVFPLRHTLSDEEFDRIIDAQGRDEQAAPFRDYAEITARSLVQVLGLDEAQARAIGAGVGRWPLFPDSAAAMARLSTRVRCAATTNSDRAHGVDVRAQLGAPSSIGEEDWICAEELGAYKPSEMVWEATSERLGLLYGPSWWHVSAYADYDLDVARGLGLTCVFVNRPHARRGTVAVDVEVADLGELADVVDGLHG